MKKTYFICLIFFTVSLFARNNPVVIIKTELGDITIEVYQKKAPVTSDNFLKYVKMNGYKNSFFFRTVTMGNQPENKIRIRVIQAGHNDQFMKETYGNKYSENTGIDHETTKKTGIMHKDGTISMARDKPGSASFSYFICIGAQPSLDFGGLRNPDGQGFAAFGKVLSGMEIVRKINASACNGQSLQPEIRVKNIIIKKVIK